MDRRLISNIVKVYPHMLKIIIYHENYILPARSDFSKIRKSTKRSGERTDASDRSLRRTRQRISDVIACNRFDLWCTFTFNCKKCPVDCHNNPCSCPRDLCRRFDPDICKLRISNWLERQKHDNKDFTYIIVPEFHKNGALHFHAFIKHFNAQLVDTKKVDNGHNVYRFKNYTLGFSYVIDISSESDENHNKIASYMQKYITKDMPQFHGKKRYFVSQNLNRPDSVVNGVEKFGLHSLIRGHKPDIMTDRFEVQYHPLHGIDLSNRKDQSSFQGMPDSVPLPSRKRLSVLQTWSH